MVLDSKHVKEYGVYHWDASGDSTVMVECFDTKEQAVVFIMDRYKGSATGADYVEVVDKASDVVAKFRVS